MDITKEKKYIKEEIDNSNDEALIDTLKDIINVSKNFDKLFKPMTKEELIKRALQSEEDIKNGNIISLEDLKKEIQTWKKK